jgi:hypothetical protein
MKDEGAESECRLLRSGDGHWLVRGRNNKQIMAAMIWGGMQGKEEPEREEESAEREPQKMCLVEPWANKGRLVLGDSWFSSVQTVENSRNSASTSLGWSKLPILSFPRTTFSRALSVPTL